MRAVEACYFGGDDDAGRMYVQLGEVLAYTARRHLREWRRNITRIRLEDLPPLKSAMANPSHVWNTWKLEWWGERLEASADGDELLLIDGDTVILRELDAVWSRPFDVALTFRQHGRLPFNGGVVFVRVSERTRFFFRQWVAINREMLGDLDFHTEWRRKYAGMNQAALGYLLERTPHRCDVARLPCPEWNCVEWPTFTPGTTRILHVKSGFRRTLFNQGPGGAAYARVLAPIIKLWRDIEREMRREEETRGRANEP